MKRYLVLRSDYFDGQLKKFSAYFIERIKRFEAQLEINPFAGKPLEAKWLREKKAGSFRVYFLVYEEFNAVYMVAISGKKDQEKIIATIRQLSMQYKEEVRMKVSERASRGLQ